MIAFIVLPSVSYLGGVYLLFTLKNEKGALIDNIHEGLPFKMGLFTRSQADIRNEQNLDILFLGSSHCYRAFDPDIFLQSHYRTFNLGSSSQTPLNSYFLLKKYIHKTSTVVLELYPVTLCNSGKESFLDMVSAKADYGTLLEQALAFKGFYALQMLSFKPFLDARLMEADSVLYRKGYAITPDSAYNKKVVYDPIMLDKSLLDVQLCYLEKIVRLCKNENKRLIFTYAPLPKKLVLRNESEVMKAIENLAVEENIPFLNMAHSLNLNDDFHFFDDDHLNSTGVELFNEEFINRLGTLQRPD